MKDDGLQYIDLALAAGLVTDRQAGMLRDELFMFPGQNARQIMIKRGWLTPEQLTQLDAQVESHDDFDDEIMMPPDATTLPSGGFSPPAYTTPPPSITPVSLSPTPLRPSPSPAPNPLAGSPLPTSQPPPQWRIAPVQGLPLGGNTPSPDLSRRRDAALNIRTPGPTGTLADYLAAARESGCSDVHFSIGRPPFVRFQGMLEFLDVAPLTADRSAELNLSLLTEGQRAELEKNQQLDFALEIPNVGRHRCNVFRQRLGWEGVFRIIPQNVPTLDELGMPPVLKKLTEYQQGLVLVTGGGGSGKTTTVAAMLDHINRTRTDHIITVEDPVEYVLQPINCHITQREVGPHTQSFGNALRGALRQDPDVIMVGDLRDMETTAIAISAAETGHLVFGTLHTNSAMRTVARVMDVYPPAQRAQICTMVAESLRGIISQQLVPRKTGIGRVLVMEILVVTSGVSQLIKEGKTHQLVTLMQSGKRLGMRTMDDALMELTQKGEISGREAYSRSDNKPMFESWDRIRPNGSD